MLQTDNLLAAAMGAVIAHPMKALMRLRDRRDRVAMHIANTVARAEFHSF